MKLRKNAKIELIRKIPLFKHCSARELGEIAAIADELDLKEGTELTSEGKSGREFFAIVEGEADVLMGGKWINSVRQGDFLGEIALDHGPAPNRDGQGDNPSAGARDHRARLPQAARALPEIQRKVLLSMAERLATATL